MKDAVTRLYPLPPVEQILEGLYLAHDIRQHAPHPDRPYVLTNFVSSLDGRIAAPEGAEGRVTVPRAIANSRDWRLFQELAAQSDVMITSGRYLREYASGKAQEILNVNNPRYADLRAWREAHGLPLRPDMAVLSASLRFPIPDNLTVDGRRVTVYTKASPDPERVREIEAGGLHVVAAGDDEAAQAQTMLAHMAELKQRVIYSVAGPEIMHLLLAGRILDRLYVTFANRMLGAEDFATMVSGPRLDPPTGFTLNTLYYDPSGLGGLGQLFVSYDIVRDVR